MPLNLSLTCFIIALTVSGVRGGSIIISGSPTTSISTLLVSPPSLRNNFIALYGEINTGDAYSLDVTTGALGPPVQLTNKDCIAKCDTSPNCAAVSFTVPTLAMTVTACYSRPFYSLSSSTSAVTPQQSFNNVTSTFTAQTYIKTPTLKLLNDCTDFIREAGSDFACTLYPGSISDPTARPASFEVLTSNSSILQGCVSEYSTRGYTLLPYEVTASISGPLTPLSCLNQCLGQGYSLSGTKAGTVCLCGSQVSDLNVVNDFICNTSCSGNKTQICGASSNYLSAYNKPAEQLITFADINGNIVSARGCFRDNPVNRILNVALSGSGAADPATMTPRSCALACSSSGFAISGVEVSDMLRLT